MCDLAHIHEEDFGRSSVCKFHQVRGRHGRLHPEIHTAKTYNLRRPFYPRATQRRGRSQSSAFRYRQSDCLATILDALRIDEIPAFDLVHSTEGLRAGERDPLWHLADIAAQRLMSAIRVCTHKPPKHGANRDRLSVVQRNSARTIASGVKSGPSAS